MLKFIELDRYRGGTCDGTYLSRLHYLEDWQTDNASRGLIDDMTRQLGGVRVRHVTGEMTLHWKSYRYMRANPVLRGSIYAMEERVRQMPLYHIPKSKVAAIESKLRSGDIIGITTNDPGGAELPTLASPIGPTTESCISCTRALRRITIGSCSICVFPNTSNIIARRPALPSHVRKNNGMRGSPSAI
jgi:hypothetical protein